MEKVYLRDAIKEVQTIEIIRNQLPEAAIGKKGLQSSFCYSYNQAVVIPNGTEKSYYKIIDSLQTSHAICMEIMGKAEENTCVKIYNILNSLAKGLIAKCTEIEPSNTILLYKDDADSLYVYRGGPFVSMLKIVTTTDSSLKLKLEQYNGNTENFTLIGWRCVKTKAHLLFLYLNVFFTMRLFFH